MKRHRIEKDDEDWFRGLFICLFCGRRWVETFPESAMKVNCLDCALEKQIDWQEVESATEWKDDESDEEEEEK